MMNGFLCKTFRIFGICCCLCFLLGNIFSVAADDFQVVDTQSESSYAVVETEDTNQLNFNYGQISDPIEITVLTSSEGEYELTSVDITSTKISAENANGFKAVLLDLFGDYEMITKEYTYTNVSQGYTSKQVTTESDYPWMFSAAIFGLVLYCLFRLLGGVLCGRK